MVRHQGAPEKFGGSCDVDGCRRSRTAQGYTGLRPLPQLIFSSRWLQLPLYVGLIVAQGVYVILFLKELWHLVLGSMSFTEQEIMLVCSG